MLDQPASVPGVITVGGCLSSAGAKALIDSRNGDPVNVDHMRRLADMLGIDRAALVADGDG